jgi:sortase A
VRILIAKAAVRRLLRLGHWVLGVSAVLMLGYSGLLWADGWYFQKAERRRFEQLLNERRPTAAISHTVLPPIAIGGVMGRVEIRRLGVSVIVAEGVDQGTLRRAAGHIPGTAQPGEAGNVAISAHRDTFFRPLRNIRQNDVVRVTTMAGNYDYRVVATKITEPSDVSVLASNGQQTLTLITCYPFYFVGSAPKRFIVQAVRTTVPWIARGD